ncbi:alpha-(1,3)-fucosyltransferase 7-like [Venturia canescens]|uniref:alpha-(1,3)-fucosyltransferase 7-like n=1 Tax=Venturia canescens TaxID=32260 RepID=UPI001C9BF257|nr:alpha-(1,3)-fucosyltransferase 7-like [Venturia canescens]
MTKMIRFRNKWIILFASFSAIGCLLVVLELAGTASMNNRAGNLSILSEWLRRYWPKRFLILVWKYGLYLDRRHVRHFSTENSESTSPWEECSVQNCHLSYRDEDLARADAVVFHLHMIQGVEELPAARGKPGQIWIFLTDESPLHTFLYADENWNVSQYNGIFDWSMSYRRNSDVPVPYGRTLAKKTVDESWRRSRKRRNKLVAILGSNCSGNNRRWEYVNELENFLGEKLDIFGRCLNGNATACPGHFDKDCPILGSYKFYLAFENSNCREYLTEKVFWNAFEKGSVPIIMGAPRSDCERLLPPGSFIHVSDFESSSSLARYLLYLDNADDAYDAYHEWRSKYTVVNEHGYFGSISKHYCRVCEALHNNNRPSKIPKYQRIKDFLNVGRDCDPYRDV